MSAFRKIWHALFSCNTHFKFSFLPYCRQEKLQHMKNLDTLNHFITGLLTFFMSNASQVIRLNSVKWWSLKQIRFNSIRSMLYQKSNCLQKLGNVIQCQCIPVRILREAGFYILILRWKNDNGKKHSDIKILFNFTRNQNCIYWLQSNLWVNNILI